MNKARLAFLFIIFSISNIKAQELFPLHEPASSIPKNVLGIRGMFEHFNEINRPRNAYALKAMYGLTSKWSIELQTQFSNHHDSLLPQDLITHRHAGSQTIYYANQKRFGLSYPTLFEGCYVFTKYRFLSLDKEQQHFRMAFFGEYSTANVAHDEAEPDLAGNNSGYGGGLIITLLKHKVAASLTAGIIIPKKYHETRYDYFYFNPVFSTTMIYGNAMHYDLSMGYLVYPKTYADYSDLNINIYAELESKWYKGAKIIQNGVEIETLTPTLIAGNYIDIHPGIQFIFNSNLRIDLSMGFKLYHRSYTHFYPLYSLGIQRYIYF